tara:strand:- start:1934 stop:3241 length:1308 start_codon:yes stop_codon:yes gene_type:complete
MKYDYKAISLFSSSGIGDLALRRLGIETIVANELLEDRCDLFERNFPESHLVRGSIIEKKLEIIKETKLRLNGRELDFALVTPPCQGMSKNGRGKLLFEIKLGKRSLIDQRNLLILPALEIIKELKPKTVIFENVSEMVYTNIPFRGQILPIIEIIKLSLGDYSIEPKVLEFADYGIPQRRLRLITIATRDPQLKKIRNNFLSLFSPPTHSKYPTNNQKKWVTVRNIIGKMEKLDGKDKISSSLDPLHKISKLDNKKYWWISHTPKNRSAFDNQCVNCLFQGNLLHKSEKNEFGINKSSKDTPLYCARCNSLLPRPTVVKNGKLNLMTGFKSAYKRIDWDLPASAITRNFPYACSDNKIHPEQNRTLSIREACMLHTISKDDYDFKVNDKKYAKTTTIRDTLGESIPPLLLEIIIKNLINLSKNLNTIKKLNNKN